MTVVLQAVPSEVRSVEIVLEHQRIYCIATGQAEGTMKLFAYAMAKSGTEYFVELEITSTTKEAKASIKSSNQSEAGTFSSHLEHTLKHELS